MRQVVRVMIQNIPLSEMRSARRSHRLMFKRITVVKNGLGSLADSSASKAAGSAIVVECLWRIAWRRSIARK